MCATQGALFRSTSVNPNVLQNSSQHAQHSGVVRRRQLLEAMGLQSVHANQREHLNSLSTTQLDHFFKCWGCSAPLDCNNLLASCESAGALEPCQTIVAHGM